MDAFDRALEMQGSGAAPSSPAELDRLASGLRSALDVLSLPDDALLLRSLVARRVASREKQPGRARVSSCLPRDLVALADLDADVRDLKAMLVEEVAGARLAEGPSVVQRRAPIRSWSPATAARLGPGRHHCRDRSGMWVDVSPNLVVCFAGAWRIHDRRRRVERSLGSYPGTSFDEAHRLALECKAHARRGEEPPKRRAPCLTVEAAINHFFEQQREVLGKKTFRQYRRNADKYLIPVIGSLPAATVRASEVAAAVRPAWLKYRRVGRDLVTVMNGALGPLKADGKRPDLPTSALKILLRKPRDADRHHKAMPHAKIRELLARARDFEAHVPCVQPWDAAAALAMEAVILTVLRRQAACWLREEAASDHDGIPVLVVPASIMKIKVRDHDVVRSAAIEDVLARARMLGVADPEGRFFVYRDPRTGLAKPVSVDSVSRFPRRLGFDTTLHGFRACFGDWATEKGYPVQWVECILAHALPPMKKPYQRTRLLKQIGPILEAWGRYATEADGGG